MCKLSSHHSQHTFSMVSPYGVSTTTPEARELASVDFALLLSETAELSINIYLQVSLPEIEYGLIHSTMTPLLQLIATHITVNCLGSYMIIEFMIVENWLNFFAVILMDCHEWHESSLCPMLLFIVRHKPAVFDGRLQLSIELLIHKWEHIVLYHCIMQAVECCIESNTEVWHVHHQQRREVGPHSCCVPQD